MKCQVINTSNCTKRTSRSFLFCSGEWMQAWNKKKKKSNQAQHQTSTRPATLNIYLHIYYQLYPVCLHLALVLYSILCTLLRHWTTAHNDMNLPFHYHDGGFIFVQWKCPPVRSLITFSSTATPEATAVRLLFFSERLYQYFDRCVILSPWQCGPWPLTAHQGRKASGPLYKQFMVQ